MWKRSQAEEKIYERAIMKIERRAAWMSGATSRDGTEKRRWLRNFSGDKRAVSFGTV